MVHCWYIEPQPSHIRFFLIHGRHLPGYGSQVVFRSYAISVNNDDIGQLHLWSVTYEISSLMVRYLPGHGPQVVFRTSATAVNNHEIRQHRLWATIWVQITLPSVGALKNAEVHFNTNGFRSRETLNCIISSGICGKEREATATIQSLVKLQSWFLSLRCKTCLRQNCSLGSCACSEGPSLGQKSLMMMVNVLQYLTFSSTGNIY